MIGLVSLGFFGWGPFIQLSWGIKPNRLEKMNKIHNFNKLYLIEARLLVSSIKSGSKRSSGLIVFAHQVHHQTQHFLWLDFHIFTWQKNSEGFFSHKISNFRIFLSFFFVIFWFVIWLNFTDQQNIRQNNTTQNNNKQRRFIFFEVIFLRSSFRFDPFDNKMKKISLEFEENKILNYIFFVFVAK